MRIGSLEYVFRLVEAAHLRSSCEENPSGAVLVKDGVVLLVAHADSPGVAPDCDHLGHSYVTERKMAPDRNALGGMSWQDVHRCVRAMPADLRLITLAAARGIPTAGASIYCSVFPGYESAQAILSAGIVEVHAGLDREASGPAKVLLSESGVKWFVGITEEGAE